MNAEPAGESNPRAARVEIAIAVVEHNGRFLIGLRPNEGPLAGFWEFPGGKVEPGEADAAALEREVMHRLGARVRPGKLISSVMHPYERYTVELFLYACTLEPGDEPEARMVASFRWVASTDFDQYPFTPADEASMTKLLGL